MTNPCDACPFSKKMEKGFTLRRLSEFASSAFSCHKTCEAEDNENGALEFRANNKSIHCAGALIFLEKRKMPNQMMQIAERLGMYDHTKLNMKAKIR